MVPVYWIVLYTLIPAALAVVGGLGASLYIPKKKFVAGLQHFVAGIVLAAVAIELLPEILGKGSVWSIGLGFAVGVIFMLLLHEGVHYLAHSDQGKKGLPLGMIAGVGIDFLMDGILIGVSFLVGMQSGILIAVSLSLCAFFLNLSVGTTMIKKEITKRKQLITILIVAAMLPLGALIGGGILSHLPSSIMQEVLSFGVAALLFLAVEELLVEVHKEHDTLWVSASFFLGFLVILLFKI